MKLALRFLLALFTILHCTTISGASIQESQARVVVEEVCIFEGESHFSAELDASKTTPTSTALTKYWPDNNGFTGEVGEAFLYKGQKIDRYGGGDWSRFFSPQGTPDFARALPPGTAGQQLRTFEVMKPFPVQSGQVAPAFGQSGGGTQLLSPVKLETLLNRGILKEVGP